MMTSVFEKHKEVASTRKDQKSMVRNGERRQSKMKFANESKFALFKASALEQNS